MAESPPPEDDPASAVTRFDGRWLGDRYRLEMQIGEGGMGVVYAAVDETLSRPVAVKVVRDEHLKAIGGREQFQREARAAASLSHPNIVTIHDYGVDGRGHPYLVMERLNGRSLRAELRREHRLPPERTLTILTGVCAAIEAAHALAMVHRDMKPENVFLVGSGRGEIAKVLDFGIAKVAAASSGVTRPATSTGALIGTPAYMSPEQIGGGKPAPAWDVWSVTVMAYEMLSGVHPFKEKAGGSGLPITRAAKIRSFDASLPVSLDDFFDRALSLDRSRRPATAGEFTTELASALGL